MFVFIGIVVCLLLAIMTHIQQINKLRHLNALIHNDIVTGTKTSAKNRPLEHLVFSVKDNFAVKGRQMTCASAFLSAFKPIYTSTVVARVLAAGGVLIGHCNMDEFAMGVSNTYSHFGACYNPWGEVTEESDAALKYPRVTGGSSGGPAVAVLTGQCDVAIGSDTSGSVRLPAAYCGVVGFKPSYGALSRYGLVPLVCSMDCPGLLARRVGLIEKVFRQIAGVDPCDSTSIDIPESNHDDRPLRVGIYLPSNDGIIEECVKARFVEAVEDLEKNFKINPQIVSIPHFDYSVPTYNTLCAVEVASNFAKYNGLVYGTKQAYSSGYKLADDVISDTRVTQLGPIVRYRVILGTFLSSNKGKQLYSQSARMRRAITSGVRSIFRSGTNPEGCDVILTPSSPGQAPTRESLEEMGPVAASRLDSYLVFPSLAGLPAVSIPIGLSPDGMPLGLQVVGDIGRDYDVLQVAEMVESCSRHSNTIRNNIEYICL